MGRTLVDYQRACCAPLAHDFRAIQHVAFSALPVTRKTKDGVVVHSTNEAQNHCIKKGKTLGTDENGIRDRLQGVQTTLCAICRSVTEG